MNRFYNNILFCLAIFIFLVFFAVNPPYVSAAQYDLIAPSGQLTRGQDVQFTINVDTEGQSLTSAEIGMSYVTTVLQYVSTTPGEAFTTVETETQEGGKLIFKASNPDGFSGTGKFATVTFKIIATASGSTELCVLFAPSPTVAPTIPVTIPVTKPTALPRTGSITQTGNGIILGGIFLLAAVTALVFIKKNPYRKPPQHHRKSLH